ncbi:selenide, water dikinase [Pasteurella bettyae CCUG 2042]|uniref:Selenide, water dikinase n=1 Tax=Pasteurella bettyae CCUG 2042 TaxID=1095749 RepID=I3DIH6_9PAST|nr:selenide, water dikinase [Pasteurella bettyae CCUG 2042]SUB21567.1 selenide, water dikinase [Pasteurella bettyae]
MLGTILHSQLEPFVDPHLLVGNETADDAAVYDLGNGTSIISTTDFFMPIVDDAFDFGRIAATNAISDIFAMGGKPIMAIAILGFPINVLPAEIAQKIVDGGRYACRQAGIALAGGHSIDAPEPIFGLAVTGIVATEKIKRNASAEAGCKLYLTKPLGIGILATAEKRGQLKPEHVGLATQAMCTMNLVGSQFSELESVTAMTDVTGFGLLGHLLEVCESANLVANVHFNKIKTLAGTSYYIEQGCLAGGVNRNYESYGHKISQMTDLQKAVLCDPQTSGGLLIAVRPEGEQEVLEIAKKAGIELSEVGELSTRENEQDPVIIHIQD